MKEDFIKGGQTVITQGDERAAAPSVGVDRVVGPQIRVDLV